MRFIFSRADQPQLIEGMCRWAGVQIGQSFDPKITSGISVLSDHGAGVVLYTRYEPNISILMSAAGKGTWITRESLAVFFGYPFQELGLRRVSTLVRRKNKIARAFNEKLGFIREGCLRKAAPNGENLLVYGMLERECRWLRAERNRSAA